MRSQKKTNRAASRLPIGNRWPFEVWIRDSKEKDHRVVRFSVDENAAWNDARRLADREYGGSVLSVRTMTKAEWEDMRAGKSANRIHPRHYGKVQIAFTSDRHGRPIAYYEYHSIGGPSFRWMRMGYDEAKMLVAQGQAREIPYTGPIAVAMKRTLANHAGLTPKLEVDTVTGPADWASALINGDDSSFDNMSPADAQKERDALQRWVDRIHKDGWYVVDVARDEDTGDVQEPRFTNSYGLHGGTAQAGDVLDYVVHRAKKQKTASARKRVSATDPYRAEILSGMARALFVQTWANYEEESGRTYPGQDLMDVAPATPSPARSAARILAKMIEQKNGKKLGELYEQALSVGGKGDPEKFGHYLAMESLGHGVSWFDDNPEFPIEFPRFEFAKTSARHYYFPRS